MKSQRPHSPGILIYLQFIIRTGFKSNLLRGFPGGPVVRDLPVSAKDTGLISDPGRYHMLQSQCYRNYSSSIALDIVLTFTGSQQRVT